MLPEENHRYRRAAADYMRLPEDDVEVVRLAARAASLADWAALAFLRRAAAATEGTRESTERSAPQKRERSV